MFELKSRIEKYPLVGLLSAMAAQAPHMSVYYPYMHFSKQRVRSPAPVNNVVLQPSCSVKALIVTAAVVPIDTRMCCVCGMTRQA